MVEPHIDIILKSLSAVHHPEKVVDTLACTTVTQSLCTRCLSINIIASIGQMTGQNKRSSASSSQEPEKKVKHQISVKTLKDSC